MNAQASNELDNERNQFHSFQEDICDQETGKILTTIKNSPDALEVIVFTSVIKGDRDYCLTKGRIVCGTGDYRDDQENYINQGIASNFRVKFNRATGDLCVEHQARGVLYKKNHLPIFKNLYFGTFYIGGFDSDTENSYEFFKFKKFPKNSKEVNTQERSPQSCS